MKFHMRANVLFEADSINDAYLKLQKHFEAMQKADHTDGALKFEGNSGIILESLKEGV